MDSKYKSYKGFLSIPNETGLDLTKTFDCGQCFRWNNIKPEIPIWRGVVQGKVYELATFIDKDGESRILFSSTIEDWEKIFIPYLDLDTDYSKLEVSKDDSFGIQAIALGKGIRILKQDFWEMLISFIISQRNNIPKIKTTIKKLSAKLGSRIIYNGRVYFAFPTAEQILKAGEEGLNGIGLGYRDKYILANAKLYAAGRLKLAHLNYNDAMYRLQTLYGVGPKVANCIALFGLHKLEAFPEDVWIKRVSEIYYKGNLNGSKYGELAGLMQQYMFYAIKKIWN